MDSLCGGSEDDVAAFILIESRVEASVAAVLWTMCFIVAISTGIYIYRRRNSCSRPTFVIVQIILLNLWLISFAIFYIMYDLTTYFQTREQTWTENIFATFGDFFYVLHLFLFTE